MPIRESVSGDSHYSDALESSSSEDEASDKDEASDEDEDTTEEEDIYTEIDPPKLRRSTRIRRKPDRWSPQ